MSHYQIDARRLLCPLPVIRTQNKVKELQRDDTLEVICTDPGVVNDIPSWARMCGHEIVDTVDNGDEIIITVRVGV